MTQMSLLPRLIWYPIVWFEGNWGERGTRICGKGHSLCNSIFFLFSFLSKMTEYMSDFNVNWTLREGEGKGIKGVATGR